MSEEQLFGENLQPEWTKHRRFATTRVYVLAPWQAEVEQWVKLKEPRDGVSTALLQEEIGIGLPYRFQLDLYENIERDDTRNWRRQGEQIELRWAIADWGTIPLNPTLYAEWKFNDAAADAYELKLLLGEQLAPRAHWGFNAFFAQETGDARATEWGLSQAISYTLIDDKLSAGVEMNFEHVRERGSKSAVEFLIGPSLQWRPTPRTHLDLVPLFGVTDDSPRVEAFVIFGIEFGRGGDNAKTNAPVSTRSR